MASQPPRGSLERTSRFCRQHEDLCRPFHHRWHTTGSFLDHRMSVGPSNAKRADARPPRRAARGPLGQTLIDVKRALLEIDLRVRPSKMQRGRDLLVLKSQDGFNEAGYTGR